MKKISSILIALFLLAFSTFAQDSRGRKPETIVQDVLALMPMQNAAELNAEISGLAGSAPQTVVILASMLKPSDAGLNAKVEYAFNALAQYASDPANAGVQPAVKSGLKKAMEDCTDEYNRDFLASLLRIVAYDEAEPVVQPQTSPDPELGKVSAKRFRKMSYGQKCQLVYRIGETRDASKFGLLQTAFKGDDGDLCKDAAVALSKLGGPASADLLITRINDADPEIRTVVKKALLSCPGDISPAVMKAFSSNDVSAELVSLAGQRRISAARHHVAEALNSDDADVRDAAYKAFKHLAEPYDMDFVAGLIDQGGEGLCDSRDAFMACVKALDDNDLKGAMEGIMARAEHPGNFYPVLAGIGTDWAADMVLAALAGPARSDAVAALEDFDNFKLAPALLDCAPENERLLVRYMDLVSRYQRSPYQMADFRKGLDVADRIASAGVKREMIAIMTTVPGPESIGRIAAYLDDPELSYAAAESVRKQASKVAQTTDYAVLENALSKARRVYALRKADGDADAGYAMDEIDTILASAEVFTNALTDEEKAQGFELLFDGHDMSRWQGALDSYTPVNGTINVASYFGDNLYTDREYRDFIYRFEFRFLVPGVNNGVGVRTPMGVDAAYYGMCELQILDHDDPIYEWLMPYQVHGSIYGVVPAKRIVHKPLGEWSYEEIIVKGDHITVSVNGEVIVDADVREACQGHNVSPDGGRNPYTVDHNDHPGLFNEKGFISFCGHGTGLQFKNIRILDLSR